MNNDEYNLNKANKVKNEILLFIQQLLPNEKIISNDRTMIKPKEIDIYIPSRKFAIEYDSFYYHSEGSGKKPRRYHIDKTMAAKNVGIKMVHIFEDEWRDKKEMVKKKIAHILKVNINHTIIAAENIINNDENVFVDNNKKDDELILIDETKLINKFFIEEESYYEILNKRKNNKNNDELIINDNLPINSLPINSNINKEKPIYARKCILREIDNTTAKDFTNKYHIQGAGHCAIRIGAFYEDELVACCTFGARRVAMGIKKTGDKEYELIRFCVGEKNVVGIAGKMFNYFLDKYKPNKIISYADRRWSDEETAFYGKIGFKLTELCAPNYFYFKQEDIINHPDTWKKWHRFNFRKQELPKKLTKFDENLTEWENMQNNGWDRIWDCGNLRYLWVKDGYVEAKVENKKVVDNNIPF